MAAWTQSSDPDFNSSYINMLKGIHAQRPSSKFFKASLLNNSQGIPDIWGKPWNDNWSSKNTIKKNSEETEIT